VDWDRIAAAGAVLALTSLLLPASGPAGGTVRVMPLGDSITQGRAGKENYRPLLWDLLRRAGADVDFVGSRNRFYVETAPTEGFDHDHEGHWGWRAEEVLARIGEWAGEAKPDVVLIHLGTNDIGNGQGIEETVEEIGGIILALRRTNGRVAVLLAGIIPVVHRETSRRIALYNNRLEELARHLDTAVSPVRMVDQFEGFDSRRDTYDGVHPNARGAGKMALRWYRALLPLLETAGGGG